MALIIKDRVKETTTTTGTGTLTLAGAASGYDAFSAIGDGNTTYYAIADGATGDWEVGIGTYTASGTTLSRDTVLESSNSDALVNLASGTKDVFVTYPADKAVILDANNEVATARATSGIIEHSNTIDANYTINTGNNAMSAGPITVSSGVSVTIPTGSTWTVV